MPRFAPIALLLALAAGVLLAHPLAAANPVAYPEGYRNWRHVKSMVLFPSHPLADPFAGIHHVYANPPALEGLAAGDYKDGAVFVFDLLAAENDGQAIGEGARTLIGVMERDATRFAATGGWGFEGFAAGDPAQRLVGDGGEGCFACHQQVEDQNYVFTRPRD